MPLPSKDPLGPLTLIFRPVHLYHQLVDLLLLDDAQLLQGEEVRSPHLHGLCTVMGAM